MSDRIKDTHSDGCHLCEATYYDYKKLQEENSLLWEYYKISKEKTLYYSDIHKGKQAWHLFVKNKCSGLVKKIEKIKGDV